MGQSSPSAYDAIDIITRHHILMSMHHLDGPKKIYEDDYIVVISSCTFASDILVVTFGSLSVRPNGLSFWGDTVFKNLGIDAVGIVAKSPNWHPKASIECAVARVSRIINGYKNIITYGASMGGYGALKHAAAFGATHTLAFSPQLSINPNELPFEQRFNNFYRESIHQRMVVESSDLAPVVFAFFDPYSATDRNHVETLGLIKIDSHAIPCRRTGHFGIRLFASSERMRKLISWCINSSIDEVRSASAILSRESDLRPKEIAFAVADKKPGLAERIFYAYEDAFSEDDRLYFWQRQTEIWKSRKESERPSSSDRYMN